MAYRLKLNNTVEENVTRILDEQLEKAQYQLSESSIEESANAIHDARKRLKKSRSLLRLVRKSLDKGVYKDEKNALRDIGRSLAPARNGEAYQKTLNHLLKRYDDMLDLQAFSDLQQGLLDFHRSKLRSLTEEAEPMISVVSALKESRSRLSKLELQKTGWDALRKNLKRNYQQGQERFSVAYEEGSDRTFHEWRKRVKDLWYDLRLLQPTWSPVLSAFKAEAHQLAKYLGDDHDIAELRDFLTHHPTVNVQESHLMVLLPLMGDRQQELRQQAKPLGQRLYAEKPNAFVKRMGDYWYSQVST